MNQFTKNLFNELHKGGSWSYYWTIEGDEKTTHWFRVGDEPPQINGADHFYFGVHPGKTNRGARHRNRIDDIQVINCLFAEFDNKDFNSGDALDHITQLPALPSVTIDSGGGYHCYWLINSTYHLDTTMQIERAKTIQADWVAFCGGDPGAKDLARVLRVPGTMNRKYDPPRPVGGGDLWPDNVRKYSLDWLEEISRPADVLHNTRVENYWLEKAVGMASEGNRNSTGFWLSCQLRDSGMSQSEAESIVRDYQRNIASGSSHYTEGEAIASLKSAYLHPPRAAAMLSKTKIEIPLDIEQSPQDENIKDLLLSESRDHEGHAQCVLSLYPNKYSFCDAFGWMFFNGRYWQRDNANAVIERAIVETLKARRLLAIQAGDGFESLVKATRSTSSNVSGTMALLKSLVLVQTNDFDSDPDLLNCNNGVLNLETGELTKHNRSQYFTYALPVDYDPESDYSEWIQFLEGVTNDPDYLQTSVGYSLTGHTWEEILFYVYGPTRSGKGTFTETLLRMTGQPLATEADFETFTAKRYGDTQNFDLAALKPCRFVAASESNKNNPLNPAKVKQLTGGNYVRCAFKHRNLFTYRPQFKIWLSSNHPANIDVDDDAAWARLRVLHFPNSYLGIEDKTLKARLSRPDNLRGVLRWVVEGAMKWYALDLGLPYPAQVKKDTQAQRDSQDFVQMFVDEELQHDPEKSYPIGALHKIYSEWCDDNGIAPKYQKAFSQSLANKGYTLARKYINGVQKRCVEGLTI